MIRYNGQRREFLTRAGLGAASLLAGSCAWSGRRRRRADFRPNLVFVFADQWRAQDVAYAGNSDVRTPNLDRLAGESVVFTTAVSGCPVCSPYRASLLTGQYPLTHGVFLNDVRLSNKAVSIAEVYRQAGYATGYIGKWHLDGDHRGAFIPKGRRQGFEFWRAYGCTHDYNNSHYYADEPVKLKWPGYDAVAQTRAAGDFIAEQAAGGPFVLFLSWGPPHAPYHTAPEKYRAMFSPQELAVRANVPAELREQAAKTLAGYYAHIAVLDDCIGEIVRTLKDAGLEENTILVFTSDHGDMLYSHGRTKKQQPWDESILVPFVLRYPAALGRTGRVIDMPINTPDIMPTLLGLSGVAIPRTVEGTDFSRMLLPGRRAGENAALISCPSPFGQWSRSSGGKEYRGVRTSRYTFVRDLNGPWLLYDNQEDPYQLANLCGLAEHAALQKRLDRLLSRRLKDTRDDFLCGWDYIRRWGYEVDESGTVAYDV